MRVLHIIYNKVKAYLSELPSLGEGLGVGALVLVQVLGIGLYTSCSSIECPVDNTVELRYAVPDTLKDTLYVWTEREDGSDTLVFNHGYNLTSFALPISYQHPEDIFIFCIADTLGQATYDTVRVEKIDFPHFESVDCGSHFFHNLTNVRYTTNGIDYVNINNPNVNYDPNIYHLNIGFKNRY